MYDPTKAPLQRSRKPSKFRQSPFLEDFSSNEKEKEKVAYKIRQIQPFDDYDICYGAPMDLINKYNTWIAKGLLITQQKR